MNNPTLSSQTKWIMLGAATVAQLAASITTQGIPTLAPFIQADLHLSLAQVGMFGSAITVGMMSALGFAGWGVDYYGERTMMVAGNTVLGLLTLGVAATSGLLPALAVLFLAGIGSAAPTPAGSRVVMDWFPGQQRGLAMGIRQTGIPLGGAVAAALLPGLAALHGWRAAVFVSGVLCLTGGLIVWAVYRPSGSGRTATPAARVSWRAIFTRDITLMALSGLMLPMAQFSLLSYLALYLRDLRGTAVAVSAGLIVLAQVSGTAGRIVWGHISDVVFGGRRKPALIAAAAMAGVMSLAMGWMPRNLPMALVSAVVLLFGFSAIGWNALWITVVAELAPAEQQGQTIGTAMMVLQVGIIAGPPLFGYVVDQTGNWHMAWSLLAVALALGVMLLAQVRERVRARHMGNGWK